MTKYFIEHSSMYNYDSRAALSINEVCISIQESETQKVESQIFESFPHWDCVRERRDFFGNLRKLFVFESLHESLILTSKSIVEIDRNLGQAEKIDIAPDIFTLESPFIQISSEFAEYFPKLSKENYTPEIVFDLVYKIYTEFTYMPDVTTVETRTWEFFKTRQGVCQDYAHLAISILRSHGIPTAYVSGYLNTLPPPGLEKILGADASHAWISVYFDNLGWVDYDPTNGLIVGSNHIIISRGRDYGDLAPLRGVVQGGGRQNLLVKVSVIQY